MILAKIPLPTLEIPDVILKASVRPDVTTKETDVPFDASCWISCCYVWPHTDQMFDEEYFLTITVKSADHAIGDAHTNGDQWSVPHGTLFVVDPRVAHYLQRRSAHHTTRVAGWVGLQWEVKRRDAKAKAREIVQQFGGTWFDSIDKRYADWKPKQKK